MKSQLDREEAYLRNLEQVNALIEYVRRAGVNALNEYQQDKVLNLTGRQIVLMSAICRLNNGSCTSGVALSRLAREVHMSVSATSHLVDTLEGLNLLRRDVDEEDRRSVLINLSNAGKQYIDTARKGMLKAIRTLTAQLSEEENVRRINLIDKVYRIAYPEYP